MTEVVKTPNFLEVHPKQQENMNVRTFIIPELLSKVAIGNCAPTSLPAAFVVANSDPFSRGRTRLCCCDDCRTTAQCAAQPTACQIQSIGQQQEQQQQQPPPPLQQLPAHQKLLEAQRRFLSQRHHHHHHNHHHHHHHQQQQQYRCQRNNIANISSGITTTTNNNNSNNFTPSAIARDSVQLLNIRVSSDHMFLLSRGLDISGTTVRLADHIWKRISDPLRVQVLEAMWTRGCLPGQPTSAVAAGAVAAQMAAMVQLYSAASLWVATKLEEIWWEVPSGQVMAKACRTTPVLLLEAEVRVLQWCEWAPYNGFVRDDVHLPTDL